MFFCHATSPSKRKKRPCRQNAWGLGAKTGPKKEKDRENSYAIRMATVTPPAAPTGALQPEPVAPPARSDQNPTQNSSSTPTPSVWSAGKGFKGKGDSNQGYGGKGAAHAKGYNLGGIPPAISAGRGSPKAPTRPKLPPYPCWCCGGNHWKDECLSYKVSGVVKMAT